MMNTSGIKVADLNPYLLCSLCSGYMIEASTIIECLHSYCRTCIYRYLDSESNKYCPVCDVQIHKTKPLLNVRPDKTLQNLIYKLVPGLLKDEMKRRQDFFAQNPSIDPSVLSINLPDEHHHVIDYNKPVLCISSNKQDCISLCLELSDRLPPLAKLHLVGLKGLKSSSEKIKDQRYLLCPSALTVGHLQRFLREKFDLPKTLKVDIYHSDEILKEVYTLKEIANIYTWRQVDPLKLFYVIYAPMKPKKLPDVNSETDACNTFSKTDSKTNSVKKVDNPIKHGTSSTKTVSCKRKSTASEKVPEVKRRKTNTKQIETIKGSKKSKQQDPVLLTPVMLGEEKITSFMDESAVISSDKNDNSIPDSYHKISLEESFFEGKDKALNTLAEHSESTLNTPTKLIESASNTPAEHIESALNTPPTECIESALNKPAEHLEPALNSPTGRIESALNKPAERLEPALNSPTGLIESALNKPVERLEPALNTPTERIESALNKPAERLEPAVNSPTGHIESALKPFDCFEPSPAVDVTLLKFESNQERSSLENNGILDKASEELKQRDKILKSDIDSGVNIFEKMLPLLSLAEASQFSKSLSCDAGKPKEGFCDDPLPQNAKTLEEVTAEMGRTLTVNLQKICMETNKAVFDKIDLLEDVISENALVVKLVDKPRFETLSVSSDVENHEQCKRNRPQMKGKILKREVGRLFIDMNEKFLRNQSRRVSQHLIRRSPSHKLRLRAGLSNRANEKKSSNKSQKQHRKIVTSSRRHMAPGKKKN